MKRLPLVVIFAFFLASLLFFLTQTVNKVQAATVTLNSTADAMIMSNNPDSKYGSNSHLYVARTATAKRRALVRFNLSSIPSNATIDSATFSVYLYGCGFSGAVDDLNIARVTTDWEEYEVTWNTHKNAFDIPDNVLNKTAPCSFDDQYHNYNIKSFVNNWHGGTWPNYGLGLYGDESEVDWIKYFAGKEDATHPHPKLVVTYSLPSGTNNNDSTTTEEDSTDTNSDQDDEASEETGKKSATISATPSAKKSTQSATVSGETKGISGLKVAAFITLTLLLVGIGAFYYFKIRRKKKTSAKKDPDNKPKPEEKDKETPEQPTD
jgi:hypothetical protein